MTRNVLMKQHFCSFFSWRLMDLDHQVRFYCHRAKIKMFFIAMWLLCLRALHSLWKRTGIMVSNGFSLQMSLLVHVFLKWRTWLMSPSLPVLCTGIENTGRADQSQFLLSLLASALTCSYVLEEMQGKKKKNTWFKLQPEFGMPFCT